MTRMKVAMLTALVMALVSAPSIRWAAAQEGPPMPKPGPAHEVLKTDVGTWDAKVEAMTPNGTMTSTGVETNTMGCSGLCLINDFKGEMMPGVAFEGHGVTTYDPKKQKYVGSWTDSMSQGLATMEGTYDAASKTMTAWMEAPDPASGAVVKMKAVSELKDPNTRVFTMYNPDGSPGMRITYTRRKTGM